MQSGLACSLFCNFSCGAIPLSPRSVIILTTPQKRSVHAVLQKPCRERSFTFMGGLANGWSPVARPWTASTQPTVETSQWLAGFPCKEAQSVNCASMAEVEPIRSPLVPSLTLLLSSALKFGVHEVNKWNFSYFSYRSFIFFFFWNLLLRIPLLFPLGKSSRYDRQDLKWAANFKQSIGSNYGMHRKQIYNVLSALKFSTEGTWNCQLANLMQMHVKKWQRIDRIAHSPSPVDRLLMSQDFVYHYHITFISLAFAPVPSASSSSVRQQNFLLNLFWLCILIG